MLWKNINKYKNTIKIEYYKKNLKNILKYFLI